jgi:Fe-S cluster assembly protein SufD
MCPPGAAIGQLDEDALFYLKARGIGAIDARNMLIHAFADDVLTGIRSESVRRTTMTLVEQMLGLPA